MGHAMSLENSLERLERFAAKVWRKNSKEDPISQLSFNEYDYLKVIQVASEPIRLTDLAMEMEVTKPSASNMVSRLTRKGLVVRCDCPQDARVKRVKLTPLALEYMAYEAKVYQTLAEQVINGLTPTETKQLNQLLDKALGKED